MRITGDLIERGRALGAELQRLERERAEAESAFTELVAELPNVTLAGVPAGGAEANVVVRTWGTTASSGGFRPHWEIAGPEGLQLLDLARGAKVAASGFVFFEDSVPAWCGASSMRCSTCTPGRTGYEELWIPFVANRAAFFGTAQFPKFEGEQYGYSTGPISF